MLPPVFTQMRMPPQVPQTLSSRNVVEWVQGLVQMLPCRIEVLVRLFQVKEHKGMHQI